MKISNFHFFPTIRCLKLRNTSSFNVNRNILHSRGCILKAEQYVIPFSFVYFHLLLDFQKKSSKLIVLIMYFYVKISFFILCYNILGLPFKLHTIIFWKYSSHRDQKYEDAGPRVFNLVFSLFLGFPRNITMHLSTILQLCYIFVLNF